jgi:hypothetical protein
VVPLLNTSGISFSLAATDLGGAHGVVVVLADEDGRQVPELGQVEGLIHLKAVTAACTGPPTHLALVGRAVAVEAEVDPAVLLVLVGEGDTRSQGNLREVTVKEDWRDKNRVTKSGLKLLGQSYRYKNRVTETRRELRRQGQKLQRQG